MSSAGLEPAILAVRRLQTYNLDRTTTEIGDFYISLPKSCVCLIYPHVKHFSNSWVWSFRIVICDVCLTFKQRLSALTWDSRMLAYASA